MKKKIPYTAETFPMWAIWIRFVDKRERNIYRGIVGEVREFGVCTSDGNHVFKSIHEYEIAGRNGEWKPFYEEIDVCQNCGSEITINYPSNGLDFCTPQCRAKAEFKAEKMWEELNDPELNFLK